MRNKLNLLASDDYQNTWAVYLCVEMLCAWLDGQQGAKGIGSEQGVIEAWDDVVAENHDGSLTHYQIKKQNGPFDDTHTCNARVDKTGEPYDLSTLDKTISALAKFSKINLPGNLSDGIVTPDRKFVLGLPQTNANIKKDLKLSQFMTLV